MKGSRAKLGDENVAANGYHYVKTSTGWTLKHHLVAEKMLGRPLLPTERCFFKNKDRNDFRPENIGVGIRNAVKNSSLNKRLTTIEERMIAFIEDSKDKKKAIGELYELIDQICNVHGIEISSFDRL